MKLPDDATGSVEVVIGNITQNVNIKDGKASVTIANLSSGQYSAAIQYSGVINTTVQKQMFYLMLINMNQKLIFLQMI